MSQLFRICSEADLPGEGGVREVVVAGRSYCVARVDGEMAVLDGLCPHQQGPLGQGMVEHGRVVCPFHAWAFDVKTGMAEHSARARVHVYDAVVEGGDLFVQLS